MHIETFTTPDGETHARIMCDDYGEGHMETGECETDAYMCGDDNLQPDQWGSDDLVTCKGCIKALAADGYGPDLEMLDGAAEVD